MNDLIWHPVIPLPYLLLAAVLVAAAIGWSLWRGVRSTRLGFFLGILRVFMLGGLFLMLLQPQMRRDEITVLRPQLAVLVDTSESMTDPVDEHQPRRFERVKEWFRSQSIREARKDFDIRVFNFDRTLNEQSQDIEPLKYNGGSSNIVDAVNQAVERFRGQPLAGILVLSDGLDTSGVAAGQAISSGVPVYTFELEHPFTKKQREKRISLASVDYPPRVVAGWDTEIRVTLWDTA